MTPAFETFMANIKHVFPGLTIYAMDEEMGLDAAGAPCGLRLMVRFEDDPIAAFTVLSEEAAIGVIQAFTLAGMKRGGDTALKALKGQS